MRAAEARRGFVLLPKRWVVERSFAHGGDLREACGDALAGGGRTGMDRNNPVWSDGQAGMLT